LFNFFTGAPNVIGAGDAATFPSKNFLGKSDQIWARLKQNLGKSDRIWANLIGFGQNQNLALEKYSNLFLS